MTPEDILSTPAKILTAQQREFYFENGYILLERIIPDEVVENLRTVTEAMVDRSREISESNEIWDLDKGHSAEKPRLRRLSSPNDHDAVYWDYASKSILPDVISDLVGPDVKFHHSKLNFKWSGGGDEVKWHQDISFWPHTNYSPCTAGTYIYDCGMEQGPLAVMPGSHNDDLYNQYNDVGEWTGCLKSADAAKLDMDKAVFLDGPAGSVTIHNCRTLHYSAQNNSDTPRPLLLNVYSAADAFSYTHNPLHSKYDKAIVRGRPARWASHDPRPCLLPPDWSGGYTSIFALQQEEDWTSAAE